MLAPSTIRYITICNNAGKGHVRLSQTKEFNSAKFAHNLRGTKQNPVALRCVFLVWLNYL